MNRETFDELLPGDTITNGKAITKIAHVLYDDEVTIMMETTGETLRWSRNKTTIEACEVVTGN